MYRYSYLLFGFFLLSINSVKAAPTEISNDPSKADPAAIVLTLTVGQYSDQISQNELDKWTKEDNIFSLSSSIKNEFGNTSYCPVSKIFCNLILTRTQKQYLHLSPDSSLDMSAIRAHVEDLSRKTNRDPLEAKFKVENGVVTSFGESQDGITLDIEKSIEAIINTLNQDQNVSNKNIALPFEAKKVSTNYGDVNNLGISSLIGKGASNFKGSPKNRIFNIKVAADRFNGLLIKPGEEFSFVKNLGEVDGEHGYLPELVIKSNVTEPEFGGGICQVSTTAFRAAINSGLEITARRNHAYPVSYYSPQGMDAAVYVPNPDLRFKNNTPNHILIQTNIVGTELTFDFYGTDDGRKTTVDGPHVTQREPDGSLKTYFTQKVIDKAGNEFINDVFKSSYNSPYKYPHPGGPVLSAKPSNWSEEEWKAYKKTLKDMAKAAMIG